MAQLYNVIFEGRVAPGQDPVAVKQAMKTLLKIDDQGIDRIFSGQSILLKKGVNAGKAEKYRRTIEAAGGLCRIEPISLEASTKPDPVSDNSAAQSGPSLPPQPTSVTHYSTPTARGVKMIITNIESVPGKRIVEHFGLVSGSTIRAKHVGKDILAGFKNLVGGELKGYTDLLQESRRQAMDRMIEQAAQLGANAIVNVRFSTSSVAQVAAELYSYGTAVKVE